MASYRDSFAFFLLYTISGVESIITVTLTAYVHADSVVTANEYKEVKDTALKWLLIVKYSYPFSRTSIKWFKG
jgi:hypothetical protein